MGTSSSTEPAENEQDPLKDHRCYTNCPVKRTAYEWHLNDPHNSALKRAKKLHSYYENLHAKKNWLIAFFLRSSMIVEDSAYAFRIGYLDDICTAITRDSSTAKLCDSGIAKRPEIWEKIDSDFEAAAKGDDALHVLRAYTRLQSFSNKINGDMAKNTYHELTLYCTPLNCNVLARTQDGIQAFITILFDRRFNDYLCKGNITVYRGSTIDNESVLEGYEEGAIIITTTFLSTSKDLEVAKIYDGSDLNTAKTGKISLLCTYNICSHRRTALEIETISEHPEEREVLIYPYVPFRILSVVKKTTQQTGKQQIEVDLEEIGDDENNNSKRQSIWTVSTNV